jgi:hypothetical protein
LLRVNAPRYAACVQRRDHVRYQIWFPVQLGSDAQAKIAMTHNTSLGGMLVALSSQLTVGELVEVTFRLPPGDIEHRLTGRVMRLEPNTRDPQGAWPYRAAIAFDEISPQLQPCLEEAAARFGVES